MEKEFTVYILYSRSKGRIYIGYTSNLIQRFHSHNSLSKKGYTVRYRPWVVLYSEWYCSKQEAMNREKFLKSGKGRKFIQDEIIPIYTNYLK